MRIFQYLIIVAVIAGGIWGLSKSRIFFSSSAAFTEVKDVITREYAYLDRADFDVKDWLSEFEKYAKQAKTQEDFRNTAQQFLRYFRDPHLNLGPYDKHDFSVIPTGSDLWAAQKSDGSFKIIDVKGGSAASAVGIRPGDEIVTIDQLPTTDAIKQVLGETANLSLTVKQLEYAVNIALGGRRNSPRSIEVIRQGAKRHFNLPSSYESSRQSRSPTPISFKLLSNQIGYIRINNSLGNLQAVPEFAKAVGELSHTTALIIDLRDTPSGGNTSVANPMLGHFKPTSYPYQSYRTQTREMPYHKAELKTALTVPSEPQYEKKVVVLVGRWTGSMG
ncbi:MAG: S41 family peptidase, partial [Pseudobdellovibrionaceae bacterium]|nr:S41 family peptidase [Pseudobdellovibrionaceae bacterium]